MKITLSKTDYILFRECPKNVWYKNHRPDIYWSATELSEFEQAIIEVGNEVEGEARKLFPTGVLIEGRDEKAQKETLDLIAKKEPTIFQPVFVKDNMMAAVDMLKYDDKSGTYSIYEIKAKNAVDEKTHYHDLAFQVILLRKFGLKVKGIKLIHLNSKYVRAGDLELEKLFIIADVSKEVEGIMEEVEDEIDEALKYSSKDSEPMGFCKCIYKGRSGHCATFKFANPEVPTYGVHDLSRIGNSKRKLQELIDVNIFEIKDIPEGFELTTIQQNQVDAYVFDRPLIRKDNIIEELNKLVFPLYFLDYETFPCALPRFDGFSPYQQIPFQYSLHILDKIGGELRHKEFLYKESGDPSFGFTESLKKDIGTSGNIIVWNKKFECKINNEIAKRIPKEKKSIDAINARVYDLMEIFSKQHFVHKDFKGKTSIKYVLPVLVPELSYKKMNIKEGGTASQSWNKIVTGKESKEEKEKIAKDLRDYCKLDTYAMYAIWKYLIEL